MCKPECVKESQMSKIELIRRFKSLKSSCTMRRGNKYLLPPDAKDYRWGLQHFGGVEPITDKRAEKIIAKMERDQRLKGV